MVDQAARCSCTGLLCRAADFGRPEHQLEPRLPLHRLTAKVVACPVAPPPGRNGSPRRTRTLVAERAKAPDHFPGRFTRSSGRTKLTICVLLLLEAGERGLSRRRQTTAIFPGQPIGVPPDNIQMREAMSDRLTDRLKHRIREVCHAVMNPQSLAPRFHQSSTSQIRQVS